MYTTLELVKTLNAAVFFFKEAMRIDESTTTAIVEPADNDIGKYITPTINASTKNGGTFSRNRSMAARFSNPIKIRQPAAISQNLDGIKKYAAD